MKLFTHIASWAVVCILPALIFISEGNHRFEEALYRSLVSLPFLMFLFYTNYYYSINKLWFKEKHLIYIFVTVVLIICISFLKYELFSILDIHKKKHQLPPFRAFIYFDFLSNLLPIIFALAIRYAQRNIHLEIVQKEAQANKLQADLAQLKYQLQPHFFFNALNNIYSLIDFDPQKAQQSIHTLSKLMRHFMQNSNERLIPLSEELNFINQYIELMKLRLTERTTLQISFPKNIPQLNIAPLLFISLIENAFKHGVSTSQSSNITFSLKVEGNNVIFNSENTIIPSQKSLYSSGIGIDNLKKRLLLLYPERHSYIIEQKDNLYISTLTISL